MSSHHNRRKRRQNHEAPLIIERIKKHEQGHEGAQRLTYEEANWAKLSPTFRAAHNRLRQARGLSPLPPPAVDLYVAPPKPVIRPTDFSSPEFIGNAREFLGGTLTPGAEGFMINGKYVK
jgi:hypothetical protein